MEKIELRPFIHRGGEWIGVFFERSHPAAPIIRKQPGAKWSQTHRCWYIPLTETAYQFLKNDLSEKFSVDASALKAYLIKRQKVQSVFPEKQQIGPGNSTTITKPVALTEVWKLSAGNLDALVSFVGQLQLKAYSPSTLKTYRNEFLQLLKILKMKPVAELTTDDLRRYMVFAMEKEGILEHTAHSRLNALKFYFEQVLGRANFFWEIPRPKKPLQLPMVLGEEELGRLFRALTNKKHQAILFTAYSAGLRVSEVVNLKLKDIDSDRMQLFIERAKGKKDRYVMLSPVLLDVLRAFVKQVVPKPQVYLFENPLKPGVAYHARSAQKVFQMAREKAGIKKSVRFHSLRHSFATHLLEKGIDIRYIKDLLGHFDIRTTERYLHVSRNQLVHITSPMDDLWAKGKIGY